MKSLQLSALLRIFQAVFLIPNKRNNPNESKRRIRRNYNRRFSRKYIAEVNQRRPKDRALLEEVCKEHDVPIELVEQLLQIEKDKSGLMRRNNLFKDIDMALKNYLKRQENENLALTA